MFQLVVAVSSIAAVSALAVWSIYYGSPEPAGGKAASAVAPQARRRGVASSLGPPAAALAVALAIAALAWAAMPNGGHVPAGADFVTLGGR